MVNLNSDVFVIGLKFTVFDIEIQEKINFD